MLVFRWHEINQTQSYLSTAAESRGALLVSFLFPN